MYLIVLSGEITSIFSRKTAVYFAKTAEEVYEYTQNNKNYQVFEFNPGKELELTSDFKLIEKKSKKKLTKKIV